MKITRIRGAAGGLAIAGLALGAVVVAQAAPAGAATKTASTELTQLAKLATVTKHSGYHRTADFGSAESATYSTGSGADTKTTHHPAPGGYAHCTIADYVRVVQLKMPVYKDGTCSRESRYGQTVTDYYSGTKFKSSSRTINDDHVVSLGDAWDTGAWKWTALKRYQFAQDTANMRAVYSKSNESKSDKDAATYLPARHRCWYAETQVKIKAKYKLGVTSAERAKLKTVLKAC